MGGIAASGADVSGVGYSQLGRGVGVSVVDVSLGEISGVGYSPLGGGVGVSVGVVGVSVGDVVSGVGFGVVAAETIPSNINTV